MIFCFNWPPEEVQFTKHIDGDCCIKEIGCKIFFFSCVKGDFNHPDRDILRTFHCISFQDSDSVSVTGFRQGIVIFKAHQAEMAMCHAVSEQFFRIIAPVKYNDGIFVYIKNLQRFKMFQCGAALGSVVVNYSCNRSGS